MASEIEDMSPNCFAVKTVKGGQAWAIAVSLSGLSLDNIDHWECFKDRTRNAAEIFKNGLSAL
jgi:hypothetical protein